MLYRKWIKSWETFEIGMSDLKCKGNILVTLCVWFDNDNDDNNNNNNNNNKWLILNILSCGFDEPHNVFKVHYSMKTKHVSDETSSTVSCTVKKYKKNIQ